SLLFHTDHPPPRPTLFPYTTLFRSLKRMLVEAGIDLERDGVRVGPIPAASQAGVSFGVAAARALEAGELDGFWANAMGTEVAVRSEEHTSELQSRFDLVCRLLLEKK